MYSLLVAAVAAVPLPVMTAVRVAAPADIDHLQHYLLMQVLIPSQWVQVAAERETREPQIRNLDRILQHLVILPPAAAEAVVILDQIMVAMVDLAVVLVGRVVPTLVPVTPLQLYPAKATAAAQVVTERAPSKVPAVVVVPVQLVVTVQAILLVQVAQVPPG
jgi:hypothetical protein